jgi:hypothetical protein
MAGKGTYVNSKYIKYEHFANMKGTIYGNGLPRGTASGKGLGTAVFM